MTELRWFSRWLLASCVRRRTDTVHLAVEELEHRALPSFGPPVPIATIDPGGTAVATGDFTGDGLSDLVVGYSKGEYVTVILNNGDGTFRNAGNFSTTLDPSSLVVADFNGDGIPDIATAGLDGPIGSVLLGNGDGTFQAPRFFDTGISTAVTDLKAGDFNGDGVPDLVAVAGGFNLAQANLLLGNGDGTFQVPRQILYRPNSVSETAAVGDFNGDGNLDLAVTEAAGDSSQMTVFLGNGDGTFGDPIAYATHSPNTTRRSVVAADLTGNGILDLAVSGIGGVDVLRGHGDGTFGPAVLTPFSPGVGTLLVTDLNQDGAPDLVTEPFSLSGQGNVLIGNGDGTFQPAQPYEAGENHVGLAVADFNGDGFPDLAVVGREGQVFILDNEADWSASPGNTFARPVTSAVGAILAGSSLASVEHAPEVVSAGPGSERELAMPGSAGSEAALLVGGTENREAAHGAGQPFRRHPSALAPAASSVLARGDGFAVAFEESSGGF
jgi:hypothetical protein